MRLITGLLLAASLYGAVDKDMQRAIAWERAKERAAARQARLEKIKPSVTYNNTANRTADEPVANEVKDPGPTGAGDAQDKTNKETRK